MIQQLEQAVRAEFPEVLVTLDRAPLMPDGDWWLDISTCGRRISVQWSVKRGYGLHTSGDDGGYGYGVGPDEVFETYQEVWARLRTRIRAAQDAP